VLFPEYISRILIVERCIDAINAILTLNKKVDSVISDIVNNFNFRLLEIGRVSKLLCNKCHYVEPTGLKLFPGDHLYILSLYVTIYTIVLDIIEEEE
jgi:hypothetical protein